ncbi:PRTRC system protein C [Flavobacterium aquidurense]|uniref:PRTRC system protein C n=1 Tax=Flavobacterium aquidurense TaxID=362413 RepID=UPI0009149C00|nr:PRTRC system protein C [Flavobacterium aquidurense]OXA73725.1 PRTRC system protein C [Flavobacterium aquidurense]SHG78813.1 PRTRC system protein C [Flavobacterium frigidimaris]
MLVATNLERIFIFRDKEQEIKLADPSSTFSPEAVLNFYAQTYPILTTATIEGPIINDDAVQYKFVSQIGTKG